MTLDTDKQIASLFGKDIGPGQKLIEGVVLNDGTKLLIEQLTAEQMQWMADQGLPVTELPPLNRAERRAAKKGAH